MGKKFWEIKAKANNPSEADIYLYIEIASWGGGYCAHSAQSFTEELESLGDISTLNVYINSPGEMYLKDMQSLMYLEERQITVK